jgi:hypothetical protein
MLVPLGVGGGGSVLGVRASQAQPGTASLLSRLHFSRLHFDFAQLGTCSLPQTQPSVLGLLVQLRNLHGLPICRKDH